MMRDGLLLPLRDSSCFQLSWWFQWGHMNRWMRKTQQVLSDWNKVRVNIKGLLETRFMNTKSKNLVNYWRILSEKGNEHWFMCSKNHPFNKWCYNNCICTCKTKKLDHYLKQYTKINKFKLTNFVSHPCTSSRRYLFSLSLLLPHT